MNRYLQHFKTITKHKYYVFHACRKSGIPWRGITHDLSKYSIKEFVTSARYFTGTRSPIAKEKEENGYSVAWANNKGHNSHHWEYWTDWKDGELYCVKMPPTDLKELLCDWVGAGKAYSSKKWTQHDNLMYYLKNKHNMHLHEETRKTIESLLTTLDEYGEDDYFELVKNIEFFY